MSSPVTSSSKPQPAYPPGAESLALPARSRGRPGLRSRIVMRALDRLRVGALELHLPDGTIRRFSGRQTSPSLNHLQASLTVHDWSALSIAASRGDIGFGEAYMDGLWSSPDVAGLLKLIAANRDAMSEVIYGRWWATLADQLRHLLRANRKSQARKNIAAHYDLGNTFYQVWLDPSMTYSSALFDTQGQWAEPVDLQAGQIRKIDRAIERLGLAGNAGERVLEIGCGWGGLAHRLLTTTPCNYVGLTLSTEQQAWAQKLLSGQPAEIRLQDYRDTHETFDGIVSIEMFEAVGEHYWDTYFKTVARCLKKSGRAVIQTITIDEKLFDRYRHHTDFIQQYIFPGGMLPSTSAFEQHAQRAGLVVEDAFFFGQDYARTLAEWTTTFQSNRQDIEAQGFDQRFMRMWHFYLAYCEAGFAQNNINVAQFTLRHR
jgi:cyclopropane-fatty-acyl-phospholipid synthase